MLLFHLLSRERVDRRGLGQGIEGGKAWQEPPAILGGPVLSFPQLLAQVHLAGPSRPLGAKLHCFSQPKLYAGSPLCSWEACCRAGLVFGIYRAGRGLCCSEAPAQSRGCSEKKQDVMEQCGTRSPRAGMLEAAESPSPGRAVSVLGLCLTSLPPRETQPLLGPCWYQSRTAEQLGAGLGSVQLAGNFEKLFLCFDLP